jgi:adenylate cyclase
VPYILLGVRESLEAPRREFARQRRHLVSWTLVLIILVMLIGRYLTRMMLAPIGRMEEGLRGVIKGDLSRRVGLEGTDELARLTQACDQMIAGFEERRNLGLFVSGSLDQPLAQGNTAGTGVRRAAVLVSDVRGFTGLTEAHPPEKVMGFLNRHLDEMAEMVKASGGVVDRFIGDAIIALFWAHDDSWECLDRCLAGAISMMARHSWLQRKRRKQGDFLYEIGIGVAIGDLQPVTLSLDAAGGRLEHQMFGSAISEAEALEQLSKEAKQTLIICSASIPELAPKFAFSPLEFRHAVELLGPKGGTEA